MAQEKVTVPDLGGIDEVEVIEIEAQVGADLEAEDTIVVLESDKATMEVPAPNGGKVTEILVSVGDKVSTGTAIAMMETATASTTEESAVEVVTESPVTPEPKTEASAPAPQQAASSEQDIDVVVPDLGGMDEVEVIELCVAEGDSLEVEESLVVLESDKATMEVPVTHSGTVISFNVKVGDKVSQGHLLAKMKAQVNAPAQAPESTPASSAQAEPAAKSEAALPNNAAPTPNAAPVSQAISTANSMTVHAGPAVRKLARELGVDLTQVSGSGPKQRIVKEDVQQYVKQRLSGSGQSAGGGVSFDVVGSNEDFSRYGPIEEVSLNKIKQVTARNMVQSQLTIPQVTQFDEADITELEEYRKGKMQSQLPEGVKVSPLAFILKACTQALVKFPQFNASLGPTGQSLILKNYYNIAVAVDTPDGLMVPVIKQADEKGVIDLAQAASDLAKKARDKKLPMDAMSGGCFTISSLGGIGGTGFTPIVSAPQVAILGVSKAAYKPIWNGSSFEPRLMLPLSLSYDHRVIDGAQAAQFTRYLCELLSDVRHLLL